MLAPHLAPPDSRDVSSLNESRHAYEWFSHICGCSFRDWRPLTGDISPPDETCHARGRVMSHLWTRHVTRVAAVCAKYECAVATYECIMPIWLRSATQRMSHAYMTRLIRMTHSCVWVMYMTIYIHRKSSLYLPLSSVNLVLKLMGTPDGSSTCSGWNRVSRWWCRVSPGIFILSWLKL